MNQQDTNLQQKIELKPGLGGFLWAYIIFSLPGFLVSVIWFIIAFILLIATAVGVSNSEDSTNPLRLSLITDGDSDSGILVYNLNGPISSESDGLGGGVNENIIIETVANDFEIIKSNEDIKNVVFSINTPGGTIFASEILGDLIADLMENKGQSEAVFYFDQIVASGGLWATYKNTDNYIYGSPYGETGSIGVIITLPNFQGLAENIGYSETVIKSSPSKDIGSLFRNLTEEEEEYFQGAVDDKYEQFIDIVENGRELSDEQVRPLANGFVFDNLEAAKLGLIDQTGSLDNAIKRAANNSNLGDNYKVWEMEPEIEFFDGLFADTNLAKIIGLPTNTTEKLDRATSLKPGTIYLIDQYRY